MSKKTGRTGRQEDEKGEGHSEDMEDHEGGPGALVVGVVALKVVGPVGGRVRGVVEEDLGLVELEEGRGM